MLFCGNDYYDAKCLNAGMTFLNIILSEGVEKCVLMTINVAKYTPTVMVFI